MYINRIPFYGIYLYGTYFYEANKSLILTRLISVLKKHKFSQKQNLEVRQFSV
jgi:hypothetical protein